MMALRQVTTFTGSYPEFNIRAPAIDLLKTGLPLKFLLFSRYHLIRASPGPDFDPRYALKRLKMTLLPRKSKCPLMRALSLSYI